MALEDNRLGPKQAGDVPHADRPVPAAGRQQAPFAIQRGEADARDLALVTLNGIRMFTVKIQ